MLLCKKDNVKGSKEWGENSLEKDDQFSNQENKMRTSFNVVSVILSIHKFLYKKGTEFSTLYASAG